MWGWRAESFGRSVFSCQEPGSGTSGFDNAISPYRGAERCGVRFSHGIPMGVAYKVPDHGSHFLCSFSTKEGH